MDYKETTRTTVRIMPDDRPGNQVPAVRVKSRYISLSYFMHLTLNALARESQLAGFTLYALKYRLEAEPASLLSGEAVQ